jgi:hypothetical protein
MTKTCVTSKPLVEPKFTKIIKIQLTTSFLRCKGVL